MKLLQSLIKERLLILAFAMAMPSPASAADSPETRQVKAAITFNIMRFITFTRHSVNEPLQLCVSRRDDMAAALLTLQGQKMGGQHLIVRVLDGDSGFYSGCDVAYIGEGLSLDLSRLHQHGTLTIGDSNRFITRGGAVGLIHFGRQVRFEVNADRAEQSGVKVSSKLLRLAVRVINQ